MGQSSIILVLLKIREFLNFYLCALLYHSTESFFFFLLFGTSVVEVVNEQVITKKKWDVLGGDARLTWYKRKIGTQIRFDEDLNLEGVSVHGTPTPSVPQQVVTDIIYLKKGSISLN